MSRFVWNPASRLFTGACTTGLNGPAAESHDVQPRPLFIPEHPPAQAVMQIFGATRAGREFCVVPTRQSPEALDTTGAPEQADGEHFQCMTSGSTGAAKRIRRSQASWIRSFQVNRQLWQIGPHDCVAVLGALSHSLSLYGALEALHLGADLLLLSGQRADRQLARMRKRPPSILYATPAQVRLLAEAAEASTVTLPLRKLLIGGAKLDPDTRAQAMRLFPAADLQVFYGASETSFIALADDSCPAESVGKAYPGVRIRICSPSGERLGQDQTGEIWINSPYEFDSYASGHSDDTGRDNGWLTVGELGQLDGDGNLFLMGRKSRMFTVADQNVFPEAVEDFLLTLDGIDHAAVLPVEDLKRGQVPVAFVQSNATRPDSAMVLANCRKSLGAISAPRALHWLSEWPMLPSGKTDLQDLARRLAEVPA